MVSHNNLNLKLNMCFSQDEKQAWTDVYREGKHWQQSMRKEEKKEKQEVDETTSTSGFVSTLKAPHAHLPKKQN